MSKTTKRKATPTRRVTPREQDRIDARNALNRGVRREREIQRLTKQLDRNREVSDRMLVQLVKNIAIDQGLDVVDADGSRASEERGSK